MRENIYLSIYNQLTNDIHEGTLQPGDKLASEHELALRFATTRETVRKALGLLSQNGYIQKVRGKGSFVLDVSKFDFPVSGLVSFKEIADKLEQPTRTLVYQLELKRPNEYVRKQLELEPAGLVWEVVRARVMDKERIILDKDYFRSDLVPELTREICEHSIYDYLEHELKLKISFAKKEITVEPLTEDDRQYLDLHQDTHVVVVRNYVYLDDAQLFEYTESRHRLDKFRFVDFARRQS
ncbi:trehalose operon repressor [Paenibacillus sp. CAA11]|uniref:trehalose operon repressor n=1 Tax=Paenibacillus sp. CAA11 TaxID=1532905 RepID=UPI000D372A66|nr:trehalose operon repressor [Paenibacillus sp. CAA11]AWB46191.1 trehalose operon repressor [Paenibacillus sp. CAA11]